MTGSVNNTDLVLTSIEDQVMYVTLNRPEKRNALSYELLTQLHAAVKEANANTDLRVFVLNAAGSSFCAGMDLQEVTISPEGGRKLLFELAHTTLAINGLSIPTIAQVQGPAIGGGCGLLSICDFVLTHDDVKLGYPEVELGICPSVVAPWLVQRIGAGEARRLLLAGGLVNGETALKIGLVTHIVARGAMDEATNALLKQIRAGDQGALAATKRSIHTLLEVGITEAVLEGAKISADILAGEEAQERLRKRIHA